VLDQPASISRIARARSAGFYVFIMMAHSFFVQGAATIAIEPDALEAAR
jgi:hypothetical protein